MEEESAKEVDCQGMMEVVIRSWVRCVNVSVWKVGRQGEEGSASGRGVEEVAFKGMCNGDGEVKEMAVRAGGGASGGARAGDIVWVKGENVAARVGALAMGGRWRDGRFRGMEVSGMGKECGVQVCL